MPLERTVGEPVFSEGSQSSSKKEKGNFRESGGLGVFANDQWIQRAGSLGRGGR